MSQSWGKRANISDLRATHGGVNIAINKQVAQCMALRIACGLSSEVGHGS
jgi:hypothetical protein